MRKPQLTTVSQNLRIERQLTESDGAAEAQGAFVQPRKDPDKRRSVFLFDACYHAFLRRLRDGLLEPPKNVLLLLNCSSSRIVSALQIFHRCIFV